MRALTRVAPRQRARRSGLRRVARLLGWLVAGCLLVTGLSALSNVGLPTHSQLLDRLDAAEKARLAEAFHLRQALGDQVWPGWGQVDVPILVYNEAYAFLVGYAAPPPGWIAMPQRQAHGGPWEAVPDDSFAGQTYYRQRLAEARFEPGAFTVLVGERWVATLATRQYAKIDFVRGFGQELPPLARPLVPYRLLWWWLMGESDVTIGALLHEVFHAYQGTVAAPRLAVAESAARHEARYPWHDPAAEAAWQKELNTLADAVQATDAAETARLAQQFLALRSQRRDQSRLDAELIDFERQREWLEGLAKYAELEIGRAAANAPAYEPLPEMAHDPDFRQYAGRVRAWSQQMDEVRRMGWHAGEVRFYYTGAAQGALLDRLMPAWKERAMQEGVWLEDLLREAVLAQRP